MYEEILDGCSSGKLYGEALSLALMSYAWQRYASSRSPVRTTQSGLSTPKLRRLLDDSANLDSDLALHDLADLVDLSPRHLCRSFKQAMGTSPYQYILKERIERSKALLRMETPRLHWSVCRWGFRAKAILRSLSGAAASITPGRFLRHSSL